VFERRKLTVSSLQDLKRALTIHFHRRKPIRILGDLIDVASWDQCRKSVSRPSALPRCAVDEWGFVGEGQNIQAQDT
jgi:hypothetical protein